MNQILFYKDMLNQYYALKAKNGTSFLEGYLFDFGVMNSKTTHKITLQLADIFLLDSIKEADVPLIFLEELKIVGFLGWDERTEPFLYPNKECPNSPDGKHVKGKTPLTNGRNELWIICKYCGKDLELCKK